MAPRPQKQCDSFNTENILLGNSPVGWEFIDTFWAKPAAQKSFHVDGVPRASDPARAAILVYNSFVSSGDWCANSSWVYARILVDSDVDVMIYSSTSDPLLGPPTTEAAFGAILDDATDYSPTSGAAIKRRCFQPVPRTISLRLGSVSPPHDRALLAARSLRLTLSYARR